MNLDVHQAAAQAQCHPDTLRKMAKAGEAPGCKVGRKWIFPADLFEAWIKDKVKEQCLSTNAVMSGGSALAAKLAARRAQQTAKPPRNSNRFSRNDSGVSTNSETVVLFRGKRLPSDG